MIGFMMHMFRSFAVVACFMYIVVRLTIVVFRIGDAMNCFLKFFFIARVRIKLVYFRGVHVSNARWK